jgi:hypothetical protein
MLIRTLTLLSVLTAAYINGYAQGRVPHGTLPPWPPANGTAYFSITPAPNSQSQSLGELSKASGLVIDGTVLTVSPRVINRRLETDVIVLVNRVVKGPEKLTKVVLTQRGGILGGYKELSAEYSLMSPGERYVFFGIVDDRPGIPPIAEISRYLIEGEWVGLFRLNGGNVYLSPGAPAALRNRYNGIPESQLMNELAAQATGQ